MAEVNIAGYRVSANPTAPNSLFSCDGGGTPPAPESYIESVTMTETDEAYIFKETDGTGEERTIGTILKIDNSRYLGGITISETETSYIFTAETVDGETEQIGIVEKTPEIDFIRPAESGKLRKIEEAVGESYLDFTGTNGGNLRLPLIYMGTFADPGNNLIQGLQTGYNHGANGEHNTYLLIRAESGLSYLYTLPDGGTIGQVLSKRSSKSYDFEWSDAGNPVIEIDENNVPVSGKFDRISIYYGNDPIVRFITDEGDFGSFGVIPGGGTTGQILRKKSGDDYDTEWGDEYSPVFDVTEVNSIGSANFCVCDITVTNPLGISEASITDGTSVYFSGSNQYTITRFTGASNGKITFRINPFGAGSSKTERVFTNEKLRVSNNPYFVFPLKSDIVYFYINHDDLTDQRATYRHDINFKILIANDKTPINFIEGDQYVTGPGATPTIFTTNNIRSQASIDTTNSGLSISNVKFYKITEVS